MQATNEATCEEDKSNTTQLENESQLAEVPISDTSLTKTQMKKQMRWQRMKKMQIEMRKDEREKKKVKRRQIAEKILQAGGSKEDIDCALRKPKFTLMKDSDNKFRVAIDMDFESYMTDSELSKAVQQVARIYSLNRHSRSPIQLYVTSLAGRVKDKFAKTNTGYTNWDINTSELSYLSLFNHEKTIDEINEAPCNIIYLTGDSENTLPEVDKLLADERIVFVIGGLVDHNRHKGLCYKRAIESNIKTAKLPINENLTLCQRQVLSTVAVYEILLKVFSSRMSWRDALISAIPKRKVGSDSPKIKNI